MKFTKFGIVNLIHWNLSFFLIISIRDLNFKKKLGCLLVTVIIPLFSVNVYQNLENRFNNKYQIELKPFQNINEFKNLENMKAGLNALGKDVSYDYVVIN